jgi:L-rhamnose mutarotase
LSVTGQVHLDAIAATPVGQRWWHSMRELMPSAAGASPLSRDLREVFHLDAPK